MGNIIDVVLSTDLFAIRFNEIDLASTSITIDRCTVDFCIVGTSVDLLSPRSLGSGRRHLRSAVHGDLVVPASRIKTLGPRAFAISGSDSWNNIPVALRELYRQIN